MLLTSLTLYPVHAQAAGGKAAKITVLNTTDSLFVCKNALSRYHTCETVLCNNCADRCAASADSLKSQQVRKRRQPQEPTSESSKTRRVRSTNNNLSFTSGRPQSKNFTDDGAASAKKEGLCKHCSTDPEGNFDRTAIKEWARKRSMGDLGFKQQAIGNLTRYFAKTWLKNACHFPTKCIMCDAFLHKNVRDLVQE
mgnify:CR=1 FL=1